MEYTAKEVAEHKSADDTWVVIHGKVYDLTGYVNEHPGGFDVLAEAAGMDASDAFDNAGHSDDAFALMETYNIGTLKGFKKMKPPAKRAPVTPKSQPRPSSVATASQAKSKLATLHVGLFSLSAAAVYYVGPRYGLKAPEPMLSFIRNISSGYRASGFFNGLLLGAGILTAADAVLAFLLMRVLSSGTSALSKYPAHVKLPKAIEDDAQLQRGWLNPTAYSELTLTAKTLVAPNVYRLTFSLPTLGTVLGLPCGQHVAIKADVAGETLTRSYTPVTNNADLGILELVIKVYPEGKLTNGYLANLRVGDEVLFRGPKGAMRYHRGLCKKIGMLAGGTGITPMFQLIRAICEDDRDTTEVSLIYANRTEQDIILRKELDTFARRYPKNIKVHYILDRAPSGWKFGTGHVTKDMIAEKLPAPGDDTKILLCGPPGMVNAAKESLVRLGFDRPGASAKMTDQVFIF